MHPKLATKKQREAIEALTERIEALEDAIAELTMKVDAVIRQLTVTKPAPRRTSGVSHKS